MRTHYGGALGTLRSPLPGDLHGQARRAVHFAQGGVEPPETLRVDVAGLLGYLRLLDEALARRVIYADGLERVLEETTVDGRRRWCWSHNYGPSHGRTEPDYPDGEEWSVIFEGGKDECLSAAREAALTTGVGSP